MLIRDKQRSPIHSSVLDKSGIDKLSFKRRIKTQHNHSTKQPNSIIPNTPNKWNHPHTYQLPSSYHTISLLSFKNRVSSTSLHYHSHCSPKPILESTTPVNTLWKPAIPTSKHTITKFDCSLRTHHPNNHSPQKPIFPAKRRRKPRRNRSETFQTENQSHLHSDKYWFIEVERVTNNTAKTTQNHSITPIDSYFSEATEQAVFRVFTSRIIHLPSINNDQRIWTKR